MNKFKPVTFLLQTAHVKRKKKEAKNNNFSRVKQKNTYQISLATEKV